MDLDPGGIVKREVEQLLVAEVVERLVQPFAQLGGDFVDSLHHAGLRVVVLVFVFAKLELLRTGSVGDLGHSDRRAGGKGGHGLLGVGVGDRGVHLGVLQLADELLDLIAVGPQRARLEDLPLVLRVLAELDGLVFGGDLDAGEPLGIEGKQPLVAQIFGGLVEAGFVEAGDGVDTRVAIHAGESPTPGGGIITDQELLRLAVLPGDDDLERGRREPVSVPIRGLLLDQPVGAERSQRSDQRVDRILVRAERLGGGNLPLGIAPLLQHHRLGVLLTDLDPRELVLGDGEDLRRGVGGRFALLGLLDFVGPPHRASERGQHNDCDEQSTWPHRLPPTPPNHQAGDDHYQWNENHARVEQAAHLPARHGEPPVVGLLGTNGDEILVR